MKIHRKEWNTAYHKNERVQVFDLIDFFALDKFLLLVFDNWENKNNIFWSWGTLPLFWTWVIHIASSTVELKFS